MYVISTPIFSVYEMRIHIQGTVKKFPELWYSTVMVGNVTFI